MEVDDMSNDLPLGEDTFKPLVFDPDEYRHYLDDTLSEEQQNELLQALWHIMSIFVDIGWGVDTVQMFLPELFENAVLDSEKLVACKDSIENEHSRSKEKGLDDE